jgi:hypothetical protein
MWISFVIRGLSNRGRPKQKYGQSHENLEHNHVVSILVLETSDHDYIYIYIYIYISRLRQRWGNKTEALIYQSFAQSLEQTPYLAETQGSKGDLVNYGWGKSNRAAPVVMESW